MNCDVRTLVAVVRSVADQHSNMVPMALVARRLGWERKRFLTAVQNSRRNGLLSGVACDRNYTPDETSFGIREEGALLAYLAIR